MGQADLFREIVEHGLIPPPHHVLANERADLLELGFLLRIGLLAASILLVDRAQELLKQDEILTSLEVVDLDVLKIGVNTQTEIRGQCIRCGRPRQKGGSRIVNEGEGNSD